MKKTIRVESIETRQTDGWTELSARVRGLHDAEDRRLWFRLPESLQAALTPTADPFLAALLPPALASGRALVIDGEVSGQLLEQVGQQMGIACWQNPVWRPVRVEARPWRGRFESEATGAFFSGGVDSFYTLLKNHDLERGENRISHLIFVLGFDLEASNEQVYAPVADRLARVAAELGVALLRVRTNVRDLTDRFVGWQYHEMGAGLAAVGLALGPLLRRVLIPSGDTMLTSLLSPSNPLSDPLWSTAATEFIHDGCEATRLERIRWRLAPSELAMRQLRVCHANYRTGSASQWNCGRCSKCLRTMVLLEAAGVLDRCPAFDGQTIELEAVRRMRPDPLYQWRSLEEARALLEREDRAPELQAALGLALRQSRRLTGWSVILMKRCLRRLMGRRGILLHRGWLLRRRADVASRQTME